MNSKLKLQPISTKGSLSLYEIYLAIKSPDINLEIIKQLEDSLTSLYLEYYFTRDIKDMLTGLTKIGYEDRQHILYVIKLGIGMDPDETSENSRGKPVIS